MAEYESPAPLRRRRRHARFAAALTGTGSALLLGFVLVASAASFVLGRHGVLAPGAWQIALGAGLAVFVLKATLDIALPPVDTTQLRQILADGFGTTMAQDAELTRQARMAIEFRARLADAEARARRSARHRLAAPLQRIDDWLDAIADLARQIAARSGEAAFQTGLAARARDRRRQLAASLDTADTGLRADTQRALEGLDAQIATAEGYGQFIAAGRLALETAVAEYGAVTGQLALALAGAQAQPSSEFLQRITRGIAATGAATTRLAGQDPPTHDEPPPSLPAPPAPA